MFDDFLFNYFITKYELVKPERNDASVYFLSVYYLYLSLSHGISHYMLLKLKGIQDHLTSGKGG
jgi:hypothetical protein